MDKRLIAKIGTVAFATGLALLVDIGDPYSKYEIDNNFVKYKPKSGKVVEYKEADKIVYYQKLFGEDLKKVKVNGDIYRYERSPVYKEARKRYHDLLNKLESARDAERKAEIKRKLDEKSEKQKEALEILRR